MHSSKLIQVFFTLSGTERTAFRKFVASPYFNKREDVQQLLQYLEDCTSPNDEKLSKQEVFKFLFPKQKYSKATDGQLRYVMSFLFKLLESFLIDQEIKKNKIQNQLHLAQAYKEKNLKKLAAKKLEISKIKHLKSKIQNIEFHQQGMLIEESIYQLNILDQPNTASNLQAFSNALDISYLSSKFRQACGMITRQSTSEADFNSGLLQQALDYLKNNNNLLDVPAIAIYYYPYLAFTQTDEQDEYFKKFKSLLFVSLDKFPDNEIQDLYHLALNFCIRKLNLQSDGFEQYFNEMFELYKIGLKHKYILDNKEINPFTFKNIVSVALQLEEFDWTANFINNYQQYLSKKHRNTYVHFALSKLKFAQKNYDEALELLQNVNYTNIFLNLNTKVMLMKIYYELDEYDVLESFLTSFRTFVNRKKQSGALRSYHQENFLNIIYFTQKLLTYNPFDKKARSELRQAIETKEVLTERDWLLAQL